MSRENSTLVRIFNHQYNVASDEGNGERVEHVASYLDEKMHDAALSSGKTAPLEVAVMAAMEIAHEVLLGRGKKETLLDQADERISSFTKRLESGGDNTDSPKSDAADDDPAADSTARF